MSAERKMYVLQRDDGKFYSRGRSSSAWKYVDGFENATLFETDYGARMRQGYGCEGQDCRVREAKVTLLD